MLCPKEAATGSRGFCQVASHTYWYPIFQFLKGIQKETQTCVSIAGFSPLATNVFFEDSTEYTNHICELNLWATHFGAWVQILHPGTPDAHSLCHLANVGPPAALDAPHFRWASPDIAGSALPLWLQVGTPLLSSSCPVRPRLLVPWCKSLFLPTAACTHHSAAVHLIPWCPSWLTSSVCVLPSQRSRILFQSKDWTGGPFWGVVDSQVLIGLDKAVKLFWNITSLRCLQWPVAPSLP